MTAALLCLLFAIVGVVSFVAGFWMGRNLPSKNAKILDGKVFIAK